MFIVQRNIRLEGREKKERKVAGVGRESPVNSLLPFWCTGGIEHNRV